MPAANHPEESTGGLKTEESYDKAGKSEERLLCYIREPYTAVSQLEKFAHEDRAF